MVMTMMMMMIDDDDDDALLCHPREGFKLCVVMTVRMIMIMIMMIMMTLMMMMILLDLLCHPQTGLLSSSHALQTSVLAMQTSFPMRGIGQKPQRKNTLTFVA